jgi:predicted dehydrogenase
MKSRSYLSIGVIGCGTITYWTHLRTLASLRNVRVTGLADPDPEALNRAAQLVDAPMFSEPDVLLASKDIDAVVIASPAGLHAEHFRAACTAGKHVYLEKPVAHDAASLSTIRACSEGTALVLAVGHNYRFHPACQRLRQRLISGSIGDIRAIFSNFTEPVEVVNMPGWKRVRRDGGGVLLDLATHHIDLYRWFLQDELARITADTRSLYSEQDSAYVRATTRSGVELCGYFAFTSSRSHQLTFHGTKGVLQLDMHAGVITEVTNRRHGYGVRKRTVTGGVTDLVWRSRKLVQPSYNPSHRLALRAFVSGIANPARRHADLATVDDGAAALQAVLDAESGVGCDGKIPPAGVASP